MMPAKPNPNAAETANRPISSCVNMNADIAAIWHVEPASTVLRPPMRSEIQPQNCRLTKAVPSSTDSIAAPCEARMPRSLQNAGKWGLRHGHRNTAEDAGGRHHREDE